MERKDYFDKEKALFFYKSTTPVFSSAVRKKEASAEVQCDFIEIFFQGFKKDEDLSRYIVKLKHVSAEGLNLWINKYYGGQKADAFFDFVIALSKYEKVPNSQQISEEYKAVIKFLEKANLTNYFWPTTFLKSSQEEKNVIFNGLLELRNSSGKRINRIAENFIYDKKDDSFFKGKSKTLYQNYKELFKDSSFKNREDNVFEYFCLSYDFFEKNSSTYNSKKIISKNEVANFFENLNDKDYGRLLVSLSNKEVELVKSLIEINNKLDKFKCFPENFDLFVDYKNYLLNFFKEDFKSKLKIESELVKQYLNFTFENIKSLETDMILHKNVYFVYQKEEGGTEIKNYDFHLNHVIDLLSHSFGFKLFAGINNDYSSSINVETKRKLTAVSGVFMPSKDLEDLFYLYQGLADYLTNFLTPKSSGSYFDWCKDLKESKYNQMPSIMIEKWEEKMFDLIFNNTNIRNGFFELRDTSCKNVFFKNTSEKTKLLAVVKKSSEKIDVVKKEKKGFRF